MFSHVLLIYPIVVLILLLFLFFLFFCGIFSIFLCRSDFQCLWLAKNLRFLDTNPIKQIETNIFKGYPFRLPPPANINQHSIINVYYPFNLLVKANESKMKANGLEVEIEMFDLQKKS